MQQNPLTISGCVSVPLQNVAITNADSGWYYAQIDLSSYIPSGTTAYSVITNSFDANVIPVINGNYLTLRCPVSKTITSPQRIAIVFYATF